MTFWDSLRSFLTTTETDVVAIITEIKVEGSAVASKIDQALHWIASNAPTIAADIEGVASVAETVGVASNPEVAAAIAAANLAVQGLNAFAAASNAGQNDAKAVLAGYVAVKQAQAATAHAAAAMAAG